MEGRRRRGRSLWASGMGNSFSSSVGKGKETSEEEEEEEKGPLLPLLRHSLHFRGKKRKKTFPSGSSSISPSPSPSRRVVAVEKENCAQIRLPKSVPSSFCRFASETLLVRRKNVSGLFRPFYFAPLSVPLRDSLRIPAICDVGLRFRCRKFGVIKFAIRENGNRKP